MMKLWVNTTNMLHSSSTNRILLSRTLHSKHQPSLLIHRTHHTRCTIWMNSTKPSRHGGLNILHLHLHPHRTWTLLRVLPQQRNLIIRNHITNHTNSNRIFWLCFTMRTNIILSRNSNHKPTYCNPLPGKHHNNLIMRGIRNQRPNTNPILRPTLHPTIRNYLTIITTCTTPS